jgi:hypothetical protein
MISEKEKEAILWKDIYHISNVELNGPCSFNFPYLFGLNHLAILHYRNTP